MASIVENPNDVNALRQLLSESQAREQVLREALIDALEYAEPNDCHACAGFEPNTFCRGHRALALPTDNTALRQFGYALVQRLFGFESTETLAIVDKLARGER